MSIILAMTTGTVDGQRHFSVRRRLMALYTTNVLVLPIQLEVGSIVVKIPTFPITRVVTRLTTCPQSSLMNVFFLMT